VQKLASFQEFPQPENLSYYWPHALGGHTVKRFSKVKRNPVIEDPERGEVDDCDFQRIRSPNLQRTRGGLPMLKKLRNVLSNDEGQDIAEYAVMLAVILVLVIGTVRLIGGNANNAFSIVGSTLQGT
jgi:Flp pilus assembly pilin Flp